jgi:biotin carboxylase
MEVAARVGGGHDAELCKAATGVDLNRLAVAFALGEHPSDTVSQGSSDSPGVTVAFMVPPAGRLEAVEGLDDAVSLPGVQWVRVYRRPGHVFRELRTGADRAGAVLATGASRDDAVLRARRAVDAVRFRVDADTP